jgi:hypothetical protein
VLWVDSHQVISNEPLCVLEPKVGELGENFPLAGDASWQNNVEDRDAIGCHDQQGLPKIVDIPNLPAAGWR